MIPALGPASRLRTSSQGHRTPISLWILTASAACMAFGLARVQPAQAQITLFGQSNAAPIQVDSRESLEWREAEELYIARGDAIVRQGPDSLRADQIVARYRTGPTGNTVIYSVVAEGGVRVVSGADRATGDRLVYNADDQSVILAGNDLTYQTATFTVQAEESIEYYENTGLAIARGQAVYQDDQGQIVRADEIAARFEEQPDGSNEIVRLDALGSVIILQGDDRATSDEAVYDLTTGLATLNGNVVITNAGNQFRGDIGEFNTNTGVSRLLNQSSGDPVRALIR